VSGCHVAVSCKIVGHASCVAPFVQFVAWTATFSWNHYSLHIYHATLAAHVFDTSTYVQCVMQYCNVVLHFLCSCAALDRQSLGPDLLVQPDQLNEQVTFITFIANCKLYNLRLITNIATGG